MGLIAYRLASRPAFLPEKTLLFLTALSDSFLKPDFYLLSTSGVHLSTFLPADPILTPAFQRCPQPCSPATTQLSQVPKSPDGPLFSTS